MYTLEERLQQLSTAVGEALKLLRLSQGDLSLLTVLDTSSLVAAINSLHACMAVINDTAGAGATTVTWSADNITAKLAEAKTQVRNDLLGGASAAFDTLQELADALGGNANFSAMMQAQVDNRVSFVAAQALTAGQCAQARDNIAAASAADLASFEASIGPTTTDIIGSYQAARN